MDESDQTWREEQGRVDWVIGQIKHRIASLQDFVGQLKADVVDIRRNFWEDVTVNFDDPNEAAETYTSIRQQAEVLSDKERSHRNAEVQLRTLRKLEPSPYFGRIDFIEAGTNAVEHVYLGVGSFRDDDGDDHLIFDWRAPISSLYYDYLPGPVRFSAPGGEVTGEMPLKRQYVIRDGVIHSLFDAGVTIGDELLREVLGKQADGQMKTIVATIQSEQNRIIRNERSRVLIVQGSAGSGKTSAALQRIAYLLYRYRDTLSAENILLFSPNPIFKSYVSTVLPELGEENMQQTTFQEYLQHRLRSDFVLEDPFDQLEYVHTAMDQPGYEARLAGIEYKSGTAFMDVLDQYVQGLREQGMRFKSVSFRGDVIVSAKQIESEFNSLDSSWSVPNRIRHLTEWLLKEVRAYSKSERTKPWVEDEIELLSREDYLAAYQSLRKRNRYTPESFDDFDRERNFLADMVIKKHFKRLRARLKRLEFIDVPALYRALFANRWDTLDFRLDSKVALHWDEICHQTTDRIDNGELAYEDMTSYLYLKERIEGVQVNMSVRHVFIDEAQDYSPFQYFFIKQLFPRSRFTVLGDLNQAIYAHATNGLDFGNLSSLYGEDKTETFILTRSYRSTRQIVEFTRQLIPGGESIEPFNRNGDKPTVTRVADHARLHTQIAHQIESLWQQGCHHIAIICKTAQESQQAHAALSKAMREQSPGQSEGQLPVQLIDKETVSFKAGIVVIPSYLAKGVEFDAVIVYNGSSVQYGEERDRRLFYTVCTRAMHALHVYFVGGLSPFIAGVDPECYKLEEGFQLLY